MTVFVKKARISDPSSPHHGEEKSLLFKNGIIDEIGGDQPSDVDEIIDVSGLWISPGWVDVGSQSGEPGHEQRETLSTLTEAGRGGGYTHLLVFPNTDPVLDSKTDIEFVYRKSDQLNMSILPIGAATVGCEGKRITEMIDLHRAGAKAFSDGSKSIQNAATILKALEYVKSFDGLIIQHPLVDSLTFSGIMHEGEYSLRLGLRGIPPLSETVSVQRELDLLKYSDSKLLLHGISSEESLNIIRTCTERFDRLFISVPAANLYLTDRSLMDYDPVYKVLPPLRSEEDRTALIQGVKDGLVQLIVSNHQAIETERKELEFQHADFGMLGLSTAFAAARTALDDEIPVDDIIPLFSHNPRDIFRLPKATIEEGSPADHTLFQPDEQWTVSEEDLRSKCRNSPFLGMELTGKSYATIWKKSLYYSF